MVNFIAIDLQLYKMFKIMQVSYFLGHGVTCAFWHVSSDNLYRWFSWLD